MTKDYLPILFQAIVAVLFSGSALIFSVILGRAGRRNPAKDSAYECGIPAEGTPQPRFSVKFYLAAMLFILFDLEIVFMYPWAIVFQDFVAAGHHAIFWSMLSFVIILTVGYVYAIMKGALDWKK